jgi:hypothetical protein
VHCHRNSDDLSQPFPLDGNRLVPAPPQSLFDLLAVRLDRSVGPDTKEHQGMAIRLDSFRIRVSMGTMRLAAGALQFVLGYAKNIVRQLGIAHGAGEHERSYQRDKDRDGVLFAPTLLYPGAHSVA